MQKIKCILCFLLIYISVNQVVYGQKKETQYVKELTYYFDIKDIPIQKVFPEKDLTIEKLFFKYIITFESQLQVSNDTIYFRLIAEKSKNDCMVRYRNFLITDAIFCDKIGCSVRFDIENEIYKTYIVDVDLPRKNFLLLDTFFVVVNDVKQIQPIILDLKLGFDTLALQKMRQKKMQIDRFYLCDSLFQKYHTDLDKIDTTFIDRFPLYTFTLNDIEKNIQKIAHQNFDSLLLASGLSAGDYQQRLSNLYQHLNLLKEFIAQNNSHLDDLFFQKAQQFEQKGDVEQAVFYYNKALSYNPLHCASVEKLSFIYCQNNRLYDNYLLWKNVKTRGEHLPCENRLITLVLDSLFNNMRQFMDNKNYYDALKIIDTAEMFCQIANHAYCSMRLPAIKEQAQQGIYMAYFDVIGKSIRVKKFRLAETYCYGLSDLMLLHHNKPEQQIDFVDIVNKIIQAQNKDVEQLLQIKQYERALVNIENIITFTDSIGMGNLPDFEEFYKIIHTNIYRQKISKVQKERNAKNYSLASTYASLAQEYKNQYQKYIIEDTLVEIDGNEMIVDNSDKYDELCANIKKYGIQRGDYVLMDSFLLLFQYDAEKSVKETALIDKKLVPSLKYAFSKCNQWVWCADFDGAKQLFSKVDKTMQAYRLETTAEMSVLKEDFLSLLETRRRLYLEEEFLRSETLTQKLIREQKYNEVRRLLLKKQKELQGKDLYSQHIYTQIQKIKMPAQFQENQLNVQILLNLKQYQEAFEKYEQNRLFYLQEHLDKFQLTCDSLITFVLQTPQEERLMAACAYFLQKKDYHNAFQVYFYMQRNNYLVKEKQIDTIAQLFHSYLNDESILTNYTFETIDKLFLSKICSKKTVKTLLNK